MLVYFGILWNTSEYILTCNKIYKTSRYNKSNGLAVSSFMIGKDKIPDFSDGDNFDHIITDIITNFQTTFTNFSVSNYSTSSLASPSTLSSSRYALIKN